MPGHLARLIASPSRISSGFASVFPRLAFGTLASNGCILQRRDNNFGNTVQGCQYVSNTLHSYVDLQDPDLRLQPIRRGGEAHTAQKIGSLH